MASTSTIPPVRDGSLCGVQLGLFFKLPIELRYEIWELIFLEIHSTPDQPTTEPQPSTEIQTSTEAPVSDDTAPPSSESPSKQEPETLSANTPSGAQPQHSQHSNNVLSILRCSRFLYHEISNHLYHDIIHRLRIHSSYHQSCYITVVMLINKKEVRWSLKDSSSMRRHLESFPFARTDPAPLHIHPSCGLNPGRTICLWTKINDLIKTLQRLPYIPSVKLRLRGDWVSEGKARCTFKSRAMYRPDHDLAIVPFTRLPRWDYDLPEELSNVISQEPEGTQHSMVYKLEKHKLANQGSSDNCNMNNEALDTDTWLLGTRIFLDNLLDTTEGNTSNLLRRDRFMNWFEDGDSWKSSYEEQLIQDLHSNANIVLGYDPGLQNASRRHYLMVNYYNAVPVRNKEHNDKPPDLTSINPHATWSSEAWLLGHAHGIPPFDWFVIKWCIKGMIVYHAYRKAHRPLYRFPDSFKKWRPESAKIFNVRIEIDPAVYSSCLGYSGRRCQCRRELLPWW